MRKVFCRNSCLFKRRRMASCNTAFDVITVVKFNNSARSTPCALLNRALDEHPNRFKRLTILRQYRRSQLETHRRPMSAGGRQTSLLPALPSRLVKRRQSYIGSKDFPMPQKTHSESCCAAASSWLAANWASNSGARQAASARAPSARVGGYKLLPETGQIKCRPWKEVLAKTSGGYTLVPVATPGSGAGSTQWTWG